MTREQMIDEAVRIMCRVNPFAGLLRPDRSLYPSPSNATRLRAMGMDFVRIADALKVSNEEVFKLLRAHRAEARQAQAATNEEEPRLQPWRTWTPEMQWAESVGDNHR